MSTATTRLRGLEIAIEYPDGSRRNAVILGLDGDVLRIAIPGCDNTVELTLTTICSADGAVEAVQREACDYPGKPVSLPAPRKRAETLTAEIRRQSAVPLDGELTETGAFEGIVGRCPCMWEMFAQIRRVAPHYRACIITGPTGAGKELVAQALHRLSPASAGPLVVCNCSAVVETLFESELFGHVKGAFTGAVTNKMGLFEYAHGGTLFLDEIGDMPLAMQAKLLRVLQNLEVQRVGSLSARKVDVRVLAATNHDLRAKIAEKSFREDLYYRLCMVEIKVPALADRDEDLGLLESYFMHKFAGQYHKPVARLSDRAQAQLSRHFWPGNVRELENVIGHACMVAALDTLDIVDFPQYIRELPCPKTAEVIAFPAPQSAPGAPDLDLRQHEQRVIEQALDRARGNQVRAAGLLGISRDKLRYRIKKHGLR